MDNPALGCLRIGYPSLGTQKDSEGHGCFDVEGTIVIHGKARFAHGSSISVGRGATMTIGSIIVTGNSNFICKKSLTIGNDVLISWGGYIMDTDFHKIFQGNSTQINGNKPITIGNNVWIGMNVTVLKGSAIPDGSVIAAGSIITKKLSEPNCVYVNNDVVKQNITWEK